MDTSSELIHSLLPLFLVTTLGVSALAVGVIEGVAEATALCVKVFSGYLSDYFRRRKLLTGLGYGLAALSKPLFPLATSFGWVVAARLIDRVGKGIRGAPRDALIADITPPTSQGAAYGLRQALDTVGAVAGPLLGIAAMLWFAGDFRAVFWLAAVPAFASVALLVIGVREPAALAAARASEPPVAFADLRRLPAAYWWVVGIAALVAATAPADLRGTAFGLFNLVSGIALLAASVLAGWLWDAFGPAQTFYAGAVFTGLSWVALMIRGRVTDSRV